MERIKISKGLKIIFSNLLFVLMLGTGCAKTNINDNSNAKVKKVNYVATTANKNELIQEKLMIKQAEKEKKIAEVQAEEQAKAQAKAKAEAQAKAQEEARARAQASQSTVSKPATPKPSPKPAPKLLIDKIRGKGNAEQAIVVTSNGYGTIYATINCFEKDNGAWRQVFSMPGVIGIHGFSDNRHEGDLTTPTGIYSLGTAFGKYSNPQTAMPYRQITSNDIWADDPRYYNTWETDPSISGEHLLRSDWLYDYAFVINFNMNPVVIGKGSGIFFHCWRSSNLGTEGCIAAEESNVKSILQWLNPSKRPIIIEGPMSEVLDM